MGYALLLAMAALCCGISHCLQGWYPRRRYELWMSFLFSFTLSSYLGGTKLTWYYSIHDLGLLIIVRCFAIIVVFPFVLESTSISDGWLCLVQ